jgi:hypothetical protein
VVSESDLVAVVIRSTKYYVQLNNFMLLGANTIETASDPVGGLALRGTGVFWTDPVAGKVRRYDIGAGNVAQTVQAMEFGCGSVATSSLGVYWTTPSDVSVKNSSADAGAPLAASQNAPFSLIADDQGVYWLTKNGELQSAGTAPGERPLRTIARDFPVLFPDVPIRAIALTPTYVVWLTSDGQILRLAR